MSNALAIAAVSAVLKDLLNNGIVDHDLSTLVGNVTVSALPPDRILGSGQTETSRLNIFMYQATPNPGWRNAGLPSRNADGYRTANPPLSLDLHYLLTAYGENEFHGEILLGYGMQILHETPVLVRDAIRAALAPVSPVTGSILPAPLDKLIASELADQIEQVRITPQAMSADEMSRLWSAIQSNYRPTAAYVASVVLIESKRSTQSALPVRNRKLYVVPFAQPAIDRVVNAADEREPIEAGATLLVKGREFSGEGLSVNIDGIEFIPAATGTTPGQISLALASPLPAGLYAGVKGVQVIRRFSMGDPETPHRGFESNVAAFVLRPKITNGPAIAASDVLARVDSSETSGGVVSHLRAGALRVRLEPNAGRNQRVTLLLNEFNAPAGNVPHAYSFSAPAGNGVVDPAPDTASVTIPFRRVLAGKYLVRVQVDGAESVPGQDAAGLFSKPVVDLS